MMRIILFYCAILAWGIVSAGELREKALAGDAVSQFELGQRYFFQNSNPTLAVYWYRKAAEQGIPLAMFHLAVCMEHSWGTPQNAATALDFYTRVEKVGMKEAGYRRAMLLWNGVFEQVEPDKKTALELLRKYAPDHAPARLALIRIFWNDPALRKEFAAELRRLAEDALKAAPLDPEVQLAVARLCRDGIGAVGDPKRAYELTGRAAGNGLVEAKMELASCLEAGYGCKADPQRAFELVKEAALAGYAPAMERDGEYLLAGDYCPHDPVKGAEFIRNARNKK